MTYAEKIRLPQWQRRRLQIMQRDLWQCVRCACKDRQLEVHHKDYYPDTEPWQYPDVDLVTLCDRCHKKEFHRDKHETYLLIAMRSKGFTACEVLAMATYIDVYPGFTMKLRQEVNQWIKNDL